MQKTTPTRIKKRSRQKVSSTFCFAVCFLPCVPGSKAYLLFVFPFVFRVKAFNAIPYYRDKVYDPQTLLAATRKQSLKGLSVPAKLNRMSLAKPASIARVSIAFHQTSPIYSRKTFLFCRPLCLWMLSNKLKIQESHQRNLQTLKLL